MKTNLENMGGLAVVAQLQPPPGAQSQLFHFHSSSLLMLCTGKAVEVHGPSAWAPATWKTQMKFLAPGVSQLRHLESEPEGRALSNVTLPFK